MCGLTHAAATGCALHPGRREGSSVQRKDPKALHPGPHPRTMPPRHRITTGGPSPSLLFYLRRPSRPDMVSQPDHHRRGPSGAPSSHPRGPVLRGLQKAPAPRSSLPSGWAGWPPVRRPSSLGVAQPSPIRTLRATLLGASVPRGLCCPSRPWNRSSPCLCGGARLGCPTKKARRPPSFGSQGGVPPCPPLLPAPSHVAPGALGSWAALCASWPSGVGEGGVRTEPWAKAGPGPPAERLGPAGPGEEAVAEASRLPGTPFPHSLLRGSPSTGDETH